MLPAAFYWIDSPEGSSLHYNAIGVASVKLGDVTIRWGGHVVYGRCGSVPHCKRYVERWVAARMGIILRSRPVAAD